MMKQEKRTAGFTLVELIVVIAVMGILAGVGTVGYSGYMKSTKEAADKQILAAVNTAFASACLENKIDVNDVTAASISVMEQKVYGLSDNMTPSPTDRSTMDASFRFYYAGNEDAVFVTENVNSLIWNSAKGTFEISTDYANMVVTLANGKVITISADDMEAILNSTYAGMGYAEVAGAMDNLNSSGQFLAKIAGLIPTDLKGNTLMNKLTAAMLAYNLIDTNKATELQNNLKVGNAGKPSYKTAATEAGNGLQMIAAKYLAGGGNVNELIGIDLGRSSTGALKSMATGNGGTKTVSAMAVQYALAQSFANSDASNGVTIDGQSVSEYLASAEDPIEAIDKVKKQSAYINDYMHSAQYEKDINGFVGTMSILGDNIGTITNPGNLDINDYLSNGIHSADAKEILTEVLGS